MSFFLFCFRRSSKEATKVGGRWMKAIGATKAAVRLSSGTTEVHVPPLVKTAFDDVRLFIKDSSIDCDSLARPHASIDNL